MRVLVTGHLGYVGSVLTSVLRNARCDVVGLDCDFYPGCEFGRVRESVPTFDVDLRDVEFADLLSFDAVVHLAALSDDALGELDPVLTREINLEATVRLAECCKAAGVSRFLYASSCAVYGHCGTDAVTERTVPAPLTTYACSKSLAEQALLALADESFHPVLLRMGSAYGISPRLRLDLVVNDLVASAAVNGRMAIRTDGAAWRPLIHVEDLASAYRAILLAPDELVSGEIFNVVHPDGNHRIIDIVDAVTDVIFKATLSSSRDVYDRRSYRVDGSKLRDTFPKLSFHWTLAKGVRQILSAVSTSGLTPGDWRSDRFRRTLRIKAEMESGRLSPELRRTDLVLA